MRQSVLFTISKMTYHNLHFLQFINLYQTPFRLWWNYVIKHSMTRFFKKKKLESLQYNASLAIIGAIRGFPNKKMYQEVGLESLRHRR